MMRRREFITLLGGSTTTSRRSFDTSIPQKESIAIFVSHPC